MRWLSSLPTWAVVVASLAFYFAIAYGSRVVFKRAVPVELREQAHSVATPLMPALGATFAVLAAITISTENAHLRAAEGVVSAEAASGARLAWASTTPGVEGEPIRTALAAYLSASTTDQAWARSGKQQQADPEVAADLAVLERVVRAEAVRKDLGTPVSTELLAGVDGLTNARRDRLAVGSQLLPGLYLLVLGFSGAALVAGAAALTLRSPRRLLVLTYGLVIVVALSIALLLALAAPFFGDLTVSPAPLQQVVDDLNTGFFTAP